MKKTFFLTSLALALIGCTQKNTGSSDGIAKNAAPVLNTTGKEVAIYHGGDIITMEGDEPTYVEAVVVKDGKIAFLGTKDEAEKQFSGATAIDLEGKTLVPGFIDPHCHFHGFGVQAVSANLLASPDGKCDDIPSLIQTLKDWYEKNGTEKTQGWIFGLGYDDAVLKEGRHPTTADLDKVSTEIPVMVAHISGHMSVYNTKGLEMIGINKNSKSPAGGTIVKNEKGELTGLIQELAHFPHLFKIITPTAPNLIDYYLDKAQEMAVSFGYTTANEGRATANHKQMADYAKKGKFIIDVNSTVDYTLPDLFKSEWYKPTYTNRYRISGVKLTLDGSPQGRTAWRTIPYVLPPEGEKSDYKGFPALPKDEDVDKVVDNAFANNWQLSVHCNGDAALDQLCRSINKAEKKYGAKDRRTTLIHGQLIRKDQLDSLKKYNMIASFFPMHTFYWGDWYKKIIGEEKAMQISPIRSALNKGIRVSSHTDAPVALPNLMMILHTTVNRVSRSGSIIGEAERLTPYEALKTFTIWGAYQFQEENTKGSFKIGKLGDMVILDKNPLKVDPMTLKDIKVVQTIKEGKTVYQKK